MDEKQALDLVAGFRRAATAHPDTTQEATGDAARDFTFIQDRERVLGTFRVVPTRGQPFFASVVVSSSKADSFSIFVIEKKKASPVLSTHRHAGTHLVWRFIPAKQSGDNEARRAEFHRLSGGDAVRIALPDIDIAPFADAIVHALDLRHRANAAGSASATSFWKISPGEGGSLWPDWRANNYIAIGWKQLGDLTGLDEDEFDQLAARVARAEGWKAGFDQVWKFRQLNTGDRVVANGGISRVLGLGTVTGAYCFVAGDELPHRIPVRWDDATERRVHFPGWVRSLIRLTAETFAELGSAPSLENDDDDDSAADGGRADIAAPGGGIDFDGVLSHLESSSLSFPAELVASYLLALQARRFVLFTGISGTGKTQLALEIARLFSPRIIGQAPSAAVDDERQLMTVKPYTLKYKRFVIPSTLAQTFDALTAPETARLDVVLPSGVTTSSALSKDPARPGLMMVLFNGEGRQFLQELQEGDRIYLSRKQQKNGEESLVIERDTAPPPLTAPGSTGPSHELIAVRPDWTDARALLGFYNPLTSKYATTPTLELVLRAVDEVKRAGIEQRPPRPYFLLFDEMNLARVEHYFSDFLSAMESGEAIHLHDDDELVDADEGAVPKRVALPPNLFVTGTVNVDETTYMCSAEMVIPVHA